MMEEGVKKPETAPLSGTGSRRKCVLLSAMGFCVVAITVGLGVGLTRDTPDLDSAPTFSVDLPTLTGDGQMYPNCEALQYDLTQASQYLSNSLIDSNVAWYFHKDYSRFHNSRFVGGPELMETSAMDTSAGSTNREPPTPSAPEFTAEDSYGTNNQVDGVEEADIVQSNGQDVFVAYGRDIVVLESDNVTVANRVRLPIAEDTCDDEIVSMLLLDTRLVVTAAKRWCHDDVYPRSFPVVQGQDQTRVYTYNVANVSSFELERQESLLGNFEAARALNSTYVYLVTRSWLDTNTLLGQYLDPSNLDYFGGSLKENQFRTAAHEVAKLRIPQFVSSFVKEIEDCSSLSGLELFQNTNTSLDFTTNGVLQSMATIYSWDVNDPLDVKYSISRRVLPSNNWQIYASQDFLVISSEGWFTHQRQSGAMESSEETYLLTYKLDGAKTKPHAMGRVPGYVLNQFSMDHINQGGTDYLRVATSTRQMWILEDSESFWRMQDLEAGTSQLSILQMQDSQLEGNSTAKWMQEAGSLTGLGKPGERLYSVRFDGDRAYAVTFRETDPFYTLDLSDPENPRAVGELEIPGFSNYLQTISENLILGVGQHADEFGRTLGLQVSLFNVTDFANPERVANLVEDSAGYSSSDAQYEHKAFRYLPENELLILPVRIYGKQGGSDFDGFKLYKIPTNGVGEITFQLDIVHETNMRSGCWSRASLESRSLVFDGNVVTFKGHSIQNLNLVTQTPLFEGISLVSKGNTECWPYVY